jgi:sensor histidine kinase YesM
MQVKRIAYLIFNRISLNILFWLLFALFHYYPQKGLWGYLVLLGVVVITYGIPVYFNNLYLIPRYLLKRKYFLYSIFMLLLLAFTTSETSFVNHWVNKIMPDVNYFKPGKNMASAYHIFPDLVMFLLLTFGKFAADVIQNEKKIDAIQKQRIQSELQSLKAQINPHFLFNALNTIYGMARRTDQTTADAVLKLSNILRHSLYQRTEHLISIEEEIILIRQYIEFTQLRLDDKNSIQLVIDIADRHPKIEPLILITFVENAIKHGIDGNVTVPWVNINIQLHEKLLAFTCSNSCHSYKTVVETENEGIGLKNVKRRLELCYRDAYDLQIFKEADQFVVILKIQLT